MENLSDADLSDSSSYSEDEECARTQPFENPCLIQYRNHLKKANIDSILKRSDLLITSTISINLTPQDRRAINMFDINLMNQNQIDEFINEKN